MTDLVLWLSGCMDRAEQEAKDADELGVGWYGLADQKPVWRLGDLARKRAILAEHVMDDHGASLAPELADEHDPPPICTRCAGARYYEPATYPCRTVRWLAVEFAAEPGFDEAWRPVQHEAPTGT